MGVSLSVDGADELPAEIASLLGAGLAELSYAEADELEDLTIMDHERYDEEVQTHQAHAKRRKVEGGGAARADDASAGGGTPEAAAAPPAAKQAKSPKQAAAKQAAAADVEVRLKVAGVKAGAGGGKGKAKPAKPAAANGKAKQAKPAAGNGKAKAKRKADEAGVDAGVSHGEGQDDVGISL